MKRMFWFSMLLILLLSACSSSSSGAKCMEGICIKIEVEGPIQALQPIPFVIYFSTEKDITGLEISMYGGVNITIADIEKKPDEAEITFQKENSIHWQIDARGGDEYLITGHLVLDKPNASIGIYSYGLIAAAGHLSIARVTDSVTMYLDAEGKQVEESRVEIESGTDIPAPPPPPDLTIIPETPFPTVFWSTDTPLPSPTPSPSPSATNTCTPTAPAYP